MTDYYCRGYIRWIFMVMVLVFGGAFLFFFLAPTQQAGGFQSAGARTIVILPLGLLFGGAVCVGLVGLLHTFTIYRLDADGMLKRWWNGSTQQLAWRDLVSAEPTQDGSGTLTDQQGNRMKLPSSEFGYRSKAGRTLQEALGEKLAKVPKAVKARLEKPSEFRFGDNTPAIAAGFMAVLCIALAVSVDLMPYSGPPPPLAFKIGLPAFFVFGALFMVYLALRQANRIFQLTDTSLIDRSLLGRQEIPFDQIVSVTTKEVPTKTGTVEITTVKSARKTISIPSRLPNYARLVKAIQARVGDQVVPNASQAVAAEAKQSLLVNVIGLFIIGCVFGVALGGLGMKALHDGQEALTRQIDLDKRGIRTTGEVLGVGKRDTKSPTYYLNYSYQVGDKSYARASTVSQDVYDSQTIGGKVLVDYLPNDPAISRTTLSIAKKNAVDKITAARVMFGIACGLPFLLGILGFTQKPRYHAPPRRKSA